MVRTSERRIVGIVVLGALALAACVPPAPPPPSEPASVPACGSTAEPTPADPVEYVAVVDEPGTDAPKVETFTATSKADKDAKVEELAAEGTVVAVEPDETVSAMVTADPRSAEQWGITNSGFASAWSAGFDGTGVRIAIIDTGVRASHQDLVGKVAQGIDFYVGSESAPAGDSDFGRLDAGGHGTHVAGIAAAADNDVGGLGGAPGATIVPVRVLGPNGSGSTSDVVDGILWAADPTMGDAQVINLSLGGSHCSTTEQAAVDYAESQGVVVVAAAGNSNTNVPIYPAGFEGEVIATGATTSTNEKASFSSWGAPYVDIAAPGATVLSAYPFDQSVPTPYPPSDTAYKYLSGTSMATPFIAATVALVLQHCPGIVNGSVNGSSIGDKVLALLRGTASPAIAGLGASLVQAGAATAAACPT